MVIGSCVCVCVCVCVCEIHSFVSNSLQLHRLYCPWNSLGQNIGVGSLSLLQGIFPTQGSNPGLPHGRRILYKLNHKGSLRILEWVAYPLQQIFPTQEPNWDLLHCRWILYQLSYLQIYMYINVKEYKGKYKKALNVRCLHRRFNISFRM